MALRRPISAGLASLTACATLALVLAQAAAAQPALDADRFEEALAARSSPYEEAVRAFYAARAFRPLWTEGTALSARGRDLRTALDRAGADGLDPDDYVPFFLPASAHRPEAVEVALTEALLRLTGDLTRGRVDPARVHRDWDAQPRAFDPALVLRRVAGQGAVAAIEAARPPHPGYARLRDALARYRALAAGGGWPTVPDGPLLRPGDHSPAVPLLRERLQREGLAAGPPPAPADGLYDPALEPAVRAAQARYGLDVDGVVGPATRAALNVPAEERAGQIALNMERWRWMPAALGARYVHVNAAGMALEVVEGGERVLSLRAIVGTVGNPTPGFGSAITHAVLSPYWYVPESIARGEVWPQVRRDPGYLARHHMEVLPGGQLRQAPGPDNPLGPVKFIFESRFGVRLHGTSNPALFETCRRAFSHGCIRIEEPLSLAALLLRGTAWDAARMAAAVAEGREVSVPLPAPVPIHVAYWTAWVEPDGAIQFRGDLYGRDRALERALAARRHVRL
jgi:murein L,D-transpeptidase YcbB/YkuD